MEAIDKKQLDKLSASIHLIKKSFECTICMDFFDDPVITNCQHAFCKNCIENFIGSKRSQSCPLCKNSINLRSLKKFSSLSPYILTTKKLEETFQKELNLLKTISTKSTDSESLKSDKENEKPQTDVSSPSIGNKRKRRTISTDESDLISKKLKSNENELASTNSIITSTRQELQNQQLNKPNNVTIVEDTLVLERHLNDMTKIPMNNKVEEWLDKNETEKCQKSSITIERIKLNNNLEQKINQENNEFPIFDGSIGDLSTDPNNSGKKDTVISELEINSDKSKTSDSKQEAPLQDLSKIDYPLKFTSESHNKTGNNSMRHKSDSNLCVTNNTTPKLSRTSLLKTPKSLEQKNRIEHFDHEQPLPILDISPKRVDNGKKSVRFKNSRPSLKRTQSDSNLSQTNQQITLSCLNCIKNRNNNNSIQINKCDQGVQCNFDDIVDNILVDFDKLISFLINRIYFILESDILDQILNDYFNSVPQIEHSTTVQSIPDSPPSHVTRIEDTLVLSHMNNDSQLTNESVNRKSSAFLSNFSELLYSTGAISKSNRKDSKRKPSLEFTVKNRTDNDGSFLDNSYIESKKMYQNVKQVDDTYVPNQTIEFSNVKYSNDSLIVEDTPIKQNYMRQDLKEINETLSKSASRLQAVMNTSNQNRSNNQSTILFEDDKENQKQTIVTDTLKLPVSESEEKNRQKELFKEPTQPKRIEFENHSFFLNSLNMTNYNHNQILLTNTTQNISQNLKDIPLAKDILGVSMANETSADISMVNTLVLEQPVLNKNGGLPTQTNKNKGKKSQTETQLLTDSACELIENICKDHYSIQNQTIFEEPVSSKPLPVISNKSIKQMEFVYSLLPAEIKTIINKYAETNGIRVVADISETTTHLIVDADKNLLCGVTSKYLKALSRKLWIVSVAWILNCINTGQMIRPDKFEIKGDKSFGVHNGPYKSRTSNTYLFDLHEFLFIGDFLSSDSVSLEDITQLVLLNGGVVRRKAKDFSLEDSSKKKIVIFDDHAKRISSKIANTLKQNNIDCVNKSWLIDSLACYKLRDFVEYHTFDTNDKN